MPRRVNPIMLFGLVIALILSLGLFAGAQSGGGAVGTALGQVGKPYAFGTDGPGSFSCTGLVRFALRSVGIMDAPWDHHAYLSAYPTVASPEPGDVVVYPDGAAMYIGGGSVVMANHADGQVGTYPMDSIGVPIGFARPTDGGGKDGGGASEPAAIDPAMGDPAMADGQIADGQMGMDSTIPVDQMADGQMGMDSTIPVDQMAVDPAAVPVDPAAVPIDPAAVPVDPAAVPVDPVAVPVDPAAVPVV